LLYVAMAAGIGFAASIVVPIFVTMALGEHGKQLGKKWFGLGLTSVYKPALTVNDVGEVLLKKRSYNDDLSREEVAIGGLTRELENPQDRIYHLLGTPFCFVDEVTGAVFDPRDADAGREAWKHFDDSSFVFREQSNRGYFERVRAFFELPEGDRAVTLSAVRHLVGGGSDAAAAERVIEHYRKSQSPRSNATAMKQLLVPLAGFVIVFLAGYFAWQQQRPPGGGGGGGATQVGWLLLAGGPLSRFRDAALAHAKKLRRSGDDGDSEPPVPPRVAAVVAGLLAATVGIEYLLSTIIPLPLLALLTAAFVGGFLVLPGTAAFLGRSLGPIGVVLAKLYVTLGLMPYDRPAIHLRADDRYELVETAGTGLEETAKWYRFARSWVGITYENSEDAWNGETTMSASEVKECGAGPRADGSSSFLPPGSVPTNVLSFGGHTGFVPARPDEDNVHVQTHHALSWFKDVGRGETISRAHQYAKDKYGGGEQPVSDKMLIVFTMAAMGFAALLDYVAFFS
jgi:hypothetical protein